jgi:polysaccharide pyruvyl transferase WcaK-like protein
MYCEIRKVGFVNKGAELMLLAAVDQLNARCPDMKLVMKAGRSNSHEPYLLRAKLGLFQKPWAWKGEYQLGDLFKFMPVKYRDMFGIVLDKELDIVLDGSGFSYSDQWGLKAIKELVRSAERWKKNGTKLIMLPQAFGPFGDELKPYAKRFIELADLVYVRDEVSLKHMKEIAGDIVVSRFYYSCGTYCLRIRGCSQRKD